MGWSLGYDSRWARDIGYGVPAYCDHPRCHEKIDRGLSYVCGDEPYGGEHGCGLYFCPSHLSYYSGNRSQACKRCGTYKPTPYKAKADHPEWVHHKLTDPSWAKWRAENIDAVQALASAGSRLAGGGL